MSIRFLCSGESHGEALNAIIEGIPAGVKIENASIDKDLARRQVGYGRGGRMQIEKDKAKILSGVRFGVSIGAPIALQIENKDWTNWQIPMSTEIQDLNDNEVVEKILEKRITKLRPGHADLAGAVKYDFDDIRNVLERSSARETTTRVAVGAICKELLKEFDITGFSHVTQIGSVCANTKNIHPEVLKQKAEASELRCADDGAFDLMRSEIDKAKELGTTLGGKIQVIFENLPVGLGSYVHWDKRLDGILAQALMSIPAVKAVEIGLGTDCANELGNKVHDEIFYEDGVIKRHSNNAGGLEGGITNGEPLVINITMKPIPTMKAPLNSIDFFSKEPIKAHFERADVCAVPACGVVAEAMCAYVLANVFLEKFGADNLSEIKTNYENYKKHLAEIYEKH